MQTRQNVEKIAKCGNFFRCARGNAKLMINFFCLTFLESMEYVLCHKKANAAKCRENG